tara:strand:+ start:234 stop:1055 length:822 start_codon:yes stop_codon:yes gene_type:complete
MNGKMSQFGLNKNMIDSVLVLDSGVGGLSVCDSIVAKLPGLNITYVADLGFYPYGLKTEEELMDRVSRVMNALLKNSSFSIAIIACNTASTLVLPKLRSEFNIPFIGVVPAIKPATQFSENRNVTLLATKGTIERNYTKALVDEYAGDCQVNFLSSNRLVDIAEGKIRGRNPDMAELKAIVQPVIDSGADTVVLGCTHFPLLREEMSSLMPGIQLVDSGEAIARRVADLLNDRSPSRSNMVNEFLYSGNIPAENELLVYLARFAMHELRNIEV